MSEEMAELTLLGMGEESTGETKVDSLVKFSNMGFHEYLRATGMSEDEYARLTTGAPSKNIYATGVTGDKMSKVGLAAQAAGGETGRRAGKAQSCTRRAHP